MPSVLLLQGVLLAVPAQPCGAAPPATQTQAFQSAVERGRCSCYDNRDRVCNILYNMITIVKYVFSRKTHSTISCDYQWHTGLPTDVPITGLRSLVRSATMDGFKAAVLRELQVVTRSPRVLALRCPLDTGRVFRPTSV